MSRSGRRVAFAPRVSWICSYCRRRKSWLAAADHLNLRRDLAFEQGQRLVPGGVMLLTKNVILQTSCLADIVSAAYCTSSRPHDRTPVPAKAEAITRALTGAAPGILRQMCAGVK